MVGSPRREPNPQLGIEWGIDPSRAILSKRDLEHPVLADAVDLF